MTVKSIANKLPLIDEDDDEAFKDFFCLSAFMRVILARLIIASSASSLISF
ncbi:hypothetical protein Hanom_Chr05g00436621 [Helianthus anomalus]